MHPSNGPDFSSLLYITPPSPLFQFLPKTESEAERNGETERVLRAFLHREGERERRELSEERERRKKERAFAFLLYSLLCVVCAVERERESDG